MYEISDACKAALNGLRVATKLKGTLTLNDGTEIPLENKDFHRGDLSINNRCVSGSDFEYGAVYCAELLAGIQTEADRYLFYNAAIAITVYIQLADGSWEDIPMGKYNITEAERTGRKVEIKAYDNMILMDDPIDLSITDLTGKPYEILSAIANMTGIVLVQSQGEIEALTNGTRVLSILVSEENTTPRDVLGELCTLLCSFAVFDRSGNLEIRTYGKKKVFTATGRKKTGTKISDYVVRYKGLKAQIGGRVLYSLDDTIPGLILDLGSNGFLQRGLESQKNEILRNMRDTLAAVNYTPCSTELMTGYPAIDLGDLIEVEDQYGASIQTYVMTYNWQYRGRHSIKGVGSNPRMHVKSQTEKTLADMVSAISTKDMMVHTYTNVSDYIVKEKVKEILSINYAAIANTRTIFIATIPFSMDLDGYIVFTYYLDEVAMTEDAVKQYVGRGQHFVTLSNNLTIEKDTRHTLSIKVHTEYHESDTRQQAAKILSLERYITTGKYTSQPIDTTPPTASIAAGTIRAALYAQGLAGTEVWDGTINMAEYIMPMALPLLPMAGFTASGSLRDTTGPGKGVTESFAAFGLPMLPLAGFAASPVPNQTVTNYTFDTENCRDYICNGAYVDTLGAYRLRTAYKYVSAQQDIEEGLLHTVTVETSSFATVRSIELEADAAGTDSRKYLICAGNVYYSAVDGELTETSITELTAEDFVTHGSDELPDGSLLLKLTDPQVLCWAADGNGELPVTARATAIPRPQTIISGAIDLTHGTIKGIENMTASCEGPLILAVSFDDQAAWKAWNGSEWIILSEETSGMGRETLEAITADQWQQLYQGADCLYIRIALVSEEQSISEVRINFVNQEVEQI